MWSRNLIEIETNLFELLKTSLEDCVESNGTLYLDLPNLFLDKSARVCYNALVQHGIRLEEQTFFQWYSKMGRYVGFKYMAFVPSQWANRDMPGSKVCGALENLNGMAIHGAKIPDE